MGLFDKLMGKSQKTYPPLDPANPAIKRIENIRGVLEPFVKQVTDNLEIVPLEKEAVVFIGKPPDAFGAAWVHNGKISNFKTLMQDRKLPPDQVQLMSDKLRDAYVRSKDTARFSAVVAGRSITVTPSESLEHDVAAVFQQLLA
jgi:hypothetical protein